MLKAWVRVFFLTSALGPFNIEVGGAGARKNLLYVLQGVDLLSNSCLGQLVIGKCSAPV